MTPAIGAVRLGPRTLAVATAAMAALLVALAILQYRWVGQVSDAERERLGRMLETAATRIADDVDREIFRAFVAFAPMRPPDEPLAARLAEGWDRWRASALEPELVEGVFVLAPRHAGTGGEGLLLALDPKRRELAPVAWPPDLVAIDHRLDLARSGRRGVAPPSRAARPHPQVSPAPALLLPVRTPPRPARRRGAEEDPAAGSTRDEGELVIVLFDRDLIVQELLPAVLDRHLGPAPRETEAWVLDRSRRGEPVFATSSPPADLEASDGVAARHLLALRSFPELRAQGFARFFDDPDAALELDAARRPEGAAGAGRAPRDERPAQWNPGWGGAASLLRSLPGGAPDQGPWALVLARSEGSLEAAVARLRRRNLGIGLAMVALLGATAGLLLASARQVQRLARREMELVAGITHELRTPLAAIGSAADNLADGVVAAPDQVRRYGALIRGESHRLGSLVAQVLDFAGTAATGRRARPLEPVDVAGVLDRVLLDHRWAIEEKGFVVERRESPDLPPVLGDREALRRALDNVVGNAIKYGGTGRWLGVEVGLLSGDRAAGARARGGATAGAQRGGRSAAARVAIRVRDRGPGIARSDRRRVFEPFYRGAGAVAAHLHGTGLGLAVTRSVLESFDGTIEVEESAPGGTTFLITVPAAPPAVPERGEEVTAPEALTER
jgi:signal transduction histidine kinase